MSKRLFFFILLLFLRTASAGGPPLVLAVSALPPWVTVSSGGVVSGPYVEIVRELARRLHQPLSVRSCPLLRCLAMARTGEADLFIGFRRGPEREEILHYLEPAFAPGVALVLYQRATLGKTVRHYEELHDLRIGVVQGARYFPRFDNDAVLTRDLAPDNPTNMQKLAAGRIDAALFNAGEGEMLRHQLGLVGALRPTLVIPTTEMRHIALSRASAHAGERARMEAVLARMVHDGIPGRLLQAVESVH